MPREHIGAVAGLGFLVVGGLLLAWSVSRAAVAVF